MKTLFSIAAAVAFSAGAALAAEPSDNWSKLCASCHGKDGAGHTRAGKKLDVKDLTSAEYQKTFTDDDAFKTLKEGFKGADGSDKMKPFADKLSDDEIKGLVAYIRAMAK
jgi:cytochrome c553